MNITVHEFPNRIGAELRGLDLAQPMDEATFLLVKQAHTDYGLLLIREQKHISHRQYTDFASRFDILMSGYPQASGYQQENEEFFQANTQKERYEHPRNPYIFVVSNVKKNGQPIGLAKAGQYWHSDMYFTERPANTSMLFSRVIPPIGGDTLAINMYQVYAALDDAIKQRIESLKIRLSYYRAWSYIYPTRAPMTEEDRIKTPDVIHSLVQRHPESGRKTLYMGAFFTDENPGASILDLPYAEGKALYAELRDFALQPQFIYRHQWQTGDILLMDNRCSIHSGTPWDDEKYPRILYRTTGIGAKTGKVAHTLLPV